MSSKNNQFTAEFAPVIASRSLASKNTLANAIRSVNSGFGESLSAVLKSGACSVALGTVVGSAMLGAPAAYAQDETGTIEEVTIMGIRGSLKRALDLKRDADGIVDAISAEDMGKFPDTNLAESLQRITGVSIDRSRGEGSRITVRGLGPDFNLVTFNSRQMPTQSGVGRSFDFANIASEGVAAVEVYKTSNAKLPSGGMGATVNVVTSKPLNDPGLSASIGVKFVHDQSTETGNSLTPEISGIYSNTFADDRIGISISASMAKRDSGENSASVGPGYRTFNSTNTSDWGTLPTNAQQTNRPSGSDIYSVPQETSYTIAEFERERVNGQLTLQWQPIDSVRATVDYTYAELDLSRRYSNLSAWYAFSGQVTTYTDGPVASPIIYSENPSADDDFPMGVGLDSSINENNSIGLNVAWDVTERLSIALDYHDSEAEARPNSRYGSSSVLGLASFNRINTTTYFNAGEIPILQLGLDTSVNPNGQRLDVNNLFVGGSVFTNTLNLMEIEQATLSGDFQLNDFSSIDFGVQLTKADNRAAVSNVQRETWSGVGNGDELADILRPASTAGYFDELSGGDDPRLQTDYFTASIESIVGRIEELIAANPGDANNNGLADGLDTWSPGDGALLGNGTRGDCDTGFCASSLYDTDRRANEETLAFYAQYNLSLETELPIDIHAGLRYEETDVESPSEVPQINGVVWAGGNAFGLESGGEPIMDLQTGKYDHVLPSFDISINVFEDVKARFGYSQSISRASFADLNGGFTVALNADVTGGGASLGNPGIEPIESTNFDVSVEWYFTDESYFSVGYFKKEVDKFIGSDTLVGQVLFPGVTTPVEGGYWNAAVADGNTSNADIYNYILTNFDGQPGVNAATGVISGIAGDPEITFNVGTVANKDKVEIDGWEIAVQHPFGESGFGGIVNLTFVDANVAYDNASTEQQFLITGLSDSANLIAYYDKEGLQARIAYNWRDDFLNGVGHNTGFREPRYTEAYGQIDFSASYEFEETLTVFVEGINVTNETTREHARTELQVLNARQTGARFLFGVRYTL